MRRALLAAPLLAVLALAGCASQISALAPVSGGDITALRIAAIDVLEQQGVEMMLVPACVTEGEGYTCSGTTYAGKPIEVTSPGTDPLGMTVTVDGAVVFEGSVKVVIDKAAQVTQ